MSYTAAVVGTGDHPDTDGPGMGVAYIHGPAYAELDDCDLVACADVVRERAETFAREFDVPEGNVYEDYRDLLDDVAPDIVSVCVPPHLHADIVVDLARSGVPSAIHCEKPMADAWGAARRMALECWRRDVQLTFNHQRRFGGQWRRAKELLDGGEVGALRRVETAAPNLYDWGTHCVDLAHFFAGDVDVEWVLGQVDYREENIAFGQHNANQALAQWAYEDGVHGLASTGAGTDALGGTDVYHRLVGTGGEIETHAGHLADETLRVRRHDDATWTPPDAQEPNPVAGALRDALDALGTGREPELSSRNALRATEVVFGTYESARRRGRVEFPLDIDDNPLASMVESGALDPAPAGE